MSPKLLLWHLISMAPTHPPKDNPIESPYCTTFPHSKSFVGVKLFIGSLLLLEWVIEPFQSLPSNYEMNYLHTAPRLLFKRPLPQNSSLIPPPSSSCARKRMLIIITSPPHHFYRSLIKLIFVISECGERSDEDSDWSSSS